MSTAQPERWRPPSCTLDAHGLRTQRERYRHAAIGAVLLERSPRRLSVELSAALDSIELEELIVTERGCCPFFEIDWNEPLRRLCFSVCDPRHEPALDAVAQALSLQ